MDIQSHVPYAGSVDLPPYLAILAFDAKDFTAAPSSTHQVISGLIPRLVGEVFETIGLRAEWDQPAFLGPTGDGFAVGLPPRILPYLVHPFPRVLQDRLTAYNQQIRPGQSLIRLRVSLHVGPLPADPADPHWTANGRPRNDTHRLLDSRPVKAILAAASPNVTHVACIFSERVFADVIDAGYAGLHPDHCLEVPATVDGKNFAQRAWLYVPQTSGSLLTVMPADEPASGRPTAGPERPPAPVVSGPRVRENSGQVATTVDTMTQNTGGTR